LERKREREGIGAGAFGKMKEGRGVFGLKSLLPPLARARTERGGKAERWSAGQGGGAGGPSHGGGREMGQNGEEAEGISSPCSPWAGVARGGGSAARFGRRRKLAVAARLVAVVEQGWAVEARLRGVERRGTAGPYL
jgi:hypothetical protein